MNKRREEMKRAVLSIVILVLIPYLAVAGNNIKWDEAPKEKLFKLLDSIKQTPQEEAIAKEYAAMSGEFGERMIVKFINGVMSIYFTDGAAARAVLQYAKPTARRALDFLLIKTGSYKGTVEFYTTNRIKMFSISGTLLNAELTLSDFYKNSYK